MFFKKNLEITIHGVTKSWTWLSTHVQILWDINHTNLRLYWECRVDFIYKSNKYNSLYYQTNKEKPYEYSQEMPKEAFDKIQHLFLTKILSPKGMGRRILNLIQGIYKNHTANKYDYLCWKFYSIYKNTTITKLAE